MKHSITVAIVIVLAVSTLHCNLDDDEEVTRVEGITEGFLAVDFTERDADGAPFQLSSCSGQIILLVFGAMWSQPCQAQAPALEDIFQTYRDQGFQVVAVMFESEQGVPADREDLQAWADTYGVTFTLLNDADRSTVARYAVDDVPLNILIDRTFTIRVRDTGFDQQALTGWIEQLLAE